MPFLPTPPTCLETKFGSLRPQMLMLFLVKLFLGSLAAGNDVSYSMMEMFNGSIPGSIAETSALWVGVGALILILTGVGSWRIMIGGIGGAALMGFLFNLWGANALMSFPWMNHLVVGGFAFGIVFMATDPVSAAQTNRGKVDLWYISRYLLYPYSSI